jgi:hypothetical protein
MDLAEDSPLHEWEEISDTSPDAEREWVHESGRFKVKIQTMGEAYSVILEDIEQNTQRKGKETTKERSVKQIADNFANDAKNILENQSS